MNAYRLFQKYERLAEIAHKLGSYACARKWSIKAEKLEAVIIALEGVKERPQMKDLEGSEKQITWAKKIREQKITSICEIAEKDPSVANTANQAIEFLSNKISAKWWIENRDNAGVAFLAYANYAQTKTDVTKLSLYQCVKRDGQVHEEKLVPAAVKIVDLTSKNAYNWVQPLAIKVTHILNDSKPIYRIANKDKFVEEKDNEGEVSAVYKLRSLLPDGWASLDVEAIVVRTFGSKDRIGGDNIKCWVFAKVKETAKVG